MFSETRYAMNGGLRVAYRTSAEGERDIMFVPNWFTNCEVFPGEGSNGLAHLDRASSLVHRSAPTITSWALPEHAKWH
jgi:hypothetical protein